MRRPLVTIAILAIMILAPWSLTTSTLEENQQNMTSGRSGTIEISELFVSPNNLVSNSTSGNMNVYNATDWNGDGDYGKYSDQFIEIWNNGSTTVDVSDWVLSTTSGSPPCQLAWNTNISADGRIVVFRADSDLDLSYYDGETVTISDDSANVVDDMTFPEGDSTYGKSYVEDSNGNLVKVTPTPGWGPNDTGTYTVAQNIVKCYKVSNTDSSRAFLLQGRVVTMESETGVINQGNVMVRDGKITGVWSDADQPPAGVDFSNVPIIETDGTIYPGLIDLHNHMHYNHIPLWDFNVHLNTNQRSDEGGYTNRYQWGDNWDYGPSITWMKNNIQDRDRWDMASEQMKYAEVQLVAGGVTAVQGSPSSGTQAWDSILSRNVELYNFGQDNVQTCAVCSWNENSYNSQAKLDDMADGDLEAWFIHLSEGVDSSSKQEFDDLFAKGLVKDQTMVIHGTGLDSSQFEKMATVNADLIWSPLSNLLLYGDTTDVVAADTAGVKISLAPDWGPSGSKSNLHELKTADLWNTDALSNHFTNYELVQMVTSNPAAATGWSNFVGKVKADLYADLVVIDTFHEDPYRNLIEAIDADVRLTVIQGKAVFGDVDIMQELQGDDWEYLNGTDFQKAVDITSLTEVDGSQTFQEIESGLAMAMRNEFDDIKANWVDVEGMDDAGINAWLGTTFDGDYKDEVNHLKNLTLDPIYTTGDDRYFDVINRSTHANYHVDLSKLYDNYYDLEMVDGDRVNVNVQLPDDTTSNNNGGDNTVLPGPDNNSGTDNTNNPDSNQEPGAPSGQNDDEFVDEAKADDDTKRQLTLILVIIVIAMMFALFIIGKTGGDELLESGEALIEKMWDDENPEPEAEENVNDSAASVEEDSTSSETVDASQSDETKQKVANAMKSAGLSAVRMFAKIDQTSDGFVSRRELRTAISGILKGNIKVKDIDAMMTTFDANGDGVISLDEFLAEMEEKQSFVPKLPEMAPPPKKK
ncbi:MAG: amidohydrolase family protein [Candidatus Thalassarchaeaceae archaeon]|nr:amidohydrolase family protein [Candidatus Thalassarchaeaceae archaeon]